MQNRHAPDRAGESRRSWRTGAARAPWQPMLPGFEVEPQTISNLFFAIFPEPAVADRIADVARRLRSKHRFRGQPLAAPRFHVPLHRIGTYAGLSGRAVAAAREAAACISMRSFDVTFDRVVSFSGSLDNRPLVLRGDKGLAALAAFRQALGVAMTRAGLGDCVEPVYTPHLTLLHDRNGVDEQAIEPISWTVREWVLVHSLVGQTRHVPLARWSLHAR